MSTYKPTFLYEPVVNSKTPSPDCAACNNGCCGTNTNKAVDDNNLDTVLEDIKSINIPTLS